MQLLDYRMRAVDIMQIIDHEAMRSLAYMEAMTHIGVCMFSLPFHGFPPGALVSNTVQRHTVQVNWLNFP